MRRTALWIVAAVAGVLLVAGVTAAASSLSTQTIGLSSEPLTAGDDLAPQPTATPRKKRKPAARSTPSPTPVPTAPPAVVDDHGGDDHGGGDSSGKGSGGSDDHGGHGSDD
jgi:hypothetical protein